MSSNPFGYSAEDATADAHDLERVQQALATKAAAEVELARALASLADRVRTATRGSASNVRMHDMRLRSVAAEVAGVMHTSDRSVQRQMDDALELVDDYPATLDAWERNEITRGHVRVITDAGSILPPDERAEFDLQAAQVATHDTPGRVKSQICLIAEKLHPRTLTERHRDARDDRLVFVVDQPDDMADLVARVPKVLAYAALDRLTAQATTIVDVRRQPGADELVASDDRSLDQLRADILADMLLTASPTADPTVDGDAPGALGAIRARVQVIVPALSLLGSGDAPGELVGHGPIDAETARRLAGCTRHPLERVLTHPVTGAVLHVDTYQRTAAIDRYLRARDQHCRFPGCRMPAVRCEVDHTRDFDEGGPTDVANLAHLCQRHHSMKQFTPWKVRQVGDGILEWTSPLGATYLDEPPRPAVAFVPDGEAPPF